MEKDLLKLDNEQCDDDFDKLLQGFLDDDTTSDDADTEDEDTVDDKTDDDVGDSYHFGGERNYIPEITKVEIQVQPNLFGSPYVNGDIAVTIQGNDDADFADNRFQLNVLGEGYYPMANTKTYFEAEHPTPNAIMLTMMSFVVWLPGRYTLYIRDNSDDSLIQMPFTLDDQLQATVSDPQPCLPCSPEDILTTSLDGYDINWNLVAQRPGMAQIRNFIIRQRQFEVYNEFRKGMRGEALSEKGHLLIGTRNRDLTSNQLLWLQMLVARNYTFGCIDCGMLFDASRNNPYEPCFEALSDTDNHVFCLTNPGALLGQGGKVIVKKIVEKIRINESRYLLWICGYKQDIEAVLSMFPSLAAFFPSNHRLEQEPPKDFEQVHAFFDALKNEKLYCSIDAMDELAHALLEGCHKGILSSWTTADIRQFVVEQVKPRYLARCYQQINDESLPQVEIDDLCLDRLISIESTYEQCLKDLDEMGGVHEVKEVSRRMAANTKCFADRRHR